MQALGVEEFRDWLKNADDVLLRRIAGLSGYGRVLLVAAKNSLLGANGFQRIDVCRFSRGNQSR